MTDELVRRVEALEAMAHPPMDVTNVVAALADSVARVVEADPHQFSKRPCESCRTISGLIARDFGCVRRARSA